METAQLFHPAACVPGGSPSPIWASAIHIVIADRAQDQLLIDRSDRRELDRCAARIALETLVAFEEGGRVAGYYYTRLPCHAAALYYLQADRSLLSGPRSL